MSKQGQNQMSEQHSAPGPSQGSGHRRPYQKPSLTEYGSVAQLTAGGSDGPDPDGVSNMFMLDMGMGM